ncbi:hypothetical protein [Lentibacillus juripiscarius]|uniref:hypothetical protein n=1 Tax=Lentibacillus juripiscarius TaxID=257446 RepID=UPI0036D340E6
MEIYSDAQDKERYGSDASHAEKVLSFLKDVLVQALVIVIAISTCPYSAVVSHISTLSYPLNHTIHYKQISMEYASRNHIFTCIAFCWPEYAGFAAGE